MNHDHPPPLARQDADPFVQALLRAGQRERAPKKAEARLLAVLGGAFALAYLEFLEVISRSTADDLGIVLVLYGIGLGALNAYALRPHAASRHTDA